jgi:hypothetical protein
MIVTTGTGLTSCLSVRLHDAHTYARYHGYWPTEIDSSKQFDIYKVNPSDRIDTLLLGDYKQPKIKPTSYDHGWQYGWYDEIDLANLSRITMDVCRPSNNVLAQAAEYRNNIGDATCVIYRGNDKAKEIAPVDYSTAIEAASSIGGPFFVQTDEQEFLEAFLKAHPNTGYTDELPRIHKNHDKYVMPVNRSTFALKFNAMLWALGQANKLLITTGNTGIWPVLYRGHTNRVWQLHGQHQTWKKI